ncbi:hypothetical protein OAN35_02525, partial [Flavobacteriaceae bacterium]|nr:hypothetical protein [Flavobacteriaceae bacterium]
MMEWFKKLYLVFSPENAIPYWLNSIQTFQDFSETKITVEENISRGNFALVIDELINPFHSWPIDHSGKFV